LLSSIRCQSSITQEKNYYCTEHTILGRNIKAYLWKLTPTISLAPQMGVVQKTQKKPHRKKQAGGSSGALGNVMIRVKIIECTIIKEVALLTTRVRVLSGIGIPESVLTE
jgi:hypothetical protein